MLQVLPHPRKRELPNSCSCLCGPYYIYMAHIMGLLLNLMFMQLRRCIGFGAALIWDSKDLTNFLRIFDQLLRLLGCCWCRPGQRIYCRLWGNRGLLWLSRNTFCWVPQRKQASMVVNSSRVSGVQRRRDCTLLWMAERRWPGLFSTAPPLLLIVSLICLLWLWGSPILPYQVEHNLSKYIVKVILL